MDEMIRMPLHRLESAIGATAWEKGDADKVWIKQHGAFERYTVG